MATGGDVGAVNKVADAQRWLKAEGPRRMRRCVTLKVLLGDNVVLPPLLSLSAG